MFVVRHPMHANQVTLHAEYDKAVKQAQSFFQNLSVERVEIGVMEVRYEVKRANAPFVINSI